MFLADAGIGHISTEFFFKMLLGYFFIPMSLAGLISGASRSPVGVILLLVQLPAIFFYLFTKARRLLQNREGGVAFAIKMFMSYFFICLSTNIVFSVLCGLLQR